jgi:hypothetical protein
LSTTTVLHSSTTIEAYWNSVKEIKKKRPENLQFLDHQLFDFIATFSSQFKGFWSTTFVRIGGNISRKKKHFLHVLRDKV